MSYNRDNNKNSGSSSKGMRQNFGRRKKILISSTIAAVAVIAAVYAITLYTQQQAQAQNMSLVQLANSAKPIYPHVTTYRGDLTNVNGTQLNELSKSSTSSTIERVNGISHVVTKDGLAELSLRHASTANGEDIISATISNTGSQKFYLVGLLIKGGTTIPETGAGGVGNLDAYIVDTGYSPEVWVNIPKPPITEPVVLNPGESLSGYIVGKWTEDVTQRPFDSFSIGATYVYNIDATGYEPGNGWAIGIQEVNLP